jgi:hypothetical protein
VPAFVSKYGGCVEFSEGRMRCAFYNMDEFRVGDAVKGMWLATSKLPADGASVVPHSLSILELLY